MKVLILQTCDGERHGPILDVTGPINRRYAEKQGYDYIEHRGIVRSDYRGFINAGGELYPQAATFNRLWLIPRFLDSIWDFILYMDADAYIWDSEVAITGVFDLSGDEAMHIAGAPDRENGFNAGVIGVNSRSSHVHGLFDEWEAVFFARKPQLSRAASGACWFKPNDQDLLGFALQTFAAQLGLPSPFADNPAVRMYPMESSRAFNYDGNFIRHAMRGFARLEGERSLQERIAMISPWR